MKVTFIPIVIGSLGTVPERLIKGLKDLEIREQVETITVIGHNTEKSPGDLRRLAVAQTPLEDHDKYLERSSGSKKHEFIECMKSLTSLIEGEGF